MPADTAFTPQFLADRDVVVAMYHDQGLPVIKHAGFGNAVNVTLGLPILRTSVDHGTALSLARTGKADAGSLRAALGVGNRVGGRRCRVWRRVSASASISCTTPAVIRRIVDAVAPLARRTRGRGGPGPRRPHLEPAGAGQGTGRDRDRPRPRAARSLRILAQGGSCACIVENVLDTDFERLRAGGPLLGSWATSLTTSPPRCCFAS